MKHVNAVAWTILMGMLSNVMIINSYIAPKTDFTQFWACKCPPGSYGHGSQSVYAYGNLCKDKNESFIVGPADIATSAVTTQQSEGNLTWLEVCSTCANGCAKCIGPSETDCLACVPGYYSHHINDEALGTESTWESQRSNKPNNHKTKRSSQANKKVHANQQTANPRMIYEEDELLTMDSGAENAQLGKNSEKASIAIDYVEYDNEESSGDSDQPKENHRIQTAEKTTIPAEAEEEEVRQVIVSKDTAFAIKEHQDPTAENTVSNAEKVNSIGTQASKQLSNKKVNQGGSASATWPKTGSARASMVSFSCLASCPDGFFNDSNRICLSCHAECDGCIDEGPANCIKCRNYKQGSACVPSCNQSGSEKNLENFNSDCELITEDEDETIPAGYYAIPPIIILLVFGCLTVSYYRRRRKMNNAIAWRPEGMPKKEMHSSESAFNRTHIDHKKCFYKGGKPPSHISLTEFRNSSEPLKRKGNPYVYAERPAPQKYAHQTVASSPAWSACKDMSEPEDEFDPLYETPDNTLDLEALKRYHQRRRSSPSHVHFSPSSKAKEIANSHGDCIDSICRESTKDINDTDGLSQVNEYQFAEESDDHSVDMEAPYYQAPPLPVRNSPCVPDSLNDDHIYVNIDENV